MSHSKFSDVCGNNAQPSGHKCLTMANNAFFSQSCENCVLTTVKQTLIIEMNFEKFRVKSFKHWPIAWLDVLKLAKNGFRYAGEGDRVICNFCFVGLHQWEPQDDIGEEHRKNSPSCPFLISPLTCGNIPMKTLLKPSAPAFEPPTRPLPQPISRPTAQPSKQPEPMVPTTVPPKTNHKWNTWRNNQLHPLPNNSSIWRPNSTVSEPWYIGAERTEASINNSSRRPHQYSWTGKSSIATQTTSAPKSKHNPMSWFKYRDCL